MDTIWNIHYLLYCWSQW